MCRLLTLVTRLLVVSCPPSSLPCASACSSCCPAPSVLPVYVACVCTVNPQSRNSRSWAQVPRSHKRMTETSDTSIRWSRGSSCSLDSEVDTQSDDSASRGTDAATTALPLTEPEGNMKSVLQDTIADLCGALDATRTIISGNDTSDARTTTLRAQSISKRARTTLSRSSEQLMNTTSLPPLPPPDSDPPCPNLQAGHHYVDLTASPHGMSPRHTRRSHAPHSPPSHPTQRNTQFI